MIDTKIEDELNDTAAKYAKRQTTVYNPANVTYTTECVNSVPLRTGALSNGWVYPDKGAYDVEEQVCCDGIMEAVNYYKVTLSDFQRLLGKVMDALDASIPNKQQHAATTRIVRKSFDATYHDMLRDFSGGGSFPVGGAYYVEPVR
jgi:hypothetical protein